ncbi:MAG: single-stranded-DNA-specific exonuclease RecJ [Legionellales bacterium]|nr:single-stranded-DNA-specific exonuclease RecJ [Legionellales bacterium]OUX67550.1 MAG: single-stranded-DNA-specific exonuclease RecJ [bacterium TMED178]|tara:strand:+ start:1276 stop:2970 length:1695 start_codon:yes stop_codon:yes gene_type:complete
MVWEIINRGEQWLGGDLIQHIYNNRNTDFKTQTNFNLNQLHHYQDLKDIDAACTRIARAIVEKEKIIIVGDYDSDGATSTALMMLALELFGSYNHSYVVPNRFEFNYGLSPELIQTMLDDKPSLIITVDNGISSLEGVDFANKHHIDVIITDHHLAPSSLPDALAIVNPNQPDDLFPSKALAGVGVAFYVMLALRQHLYEKKIIRDLPNMSQFLDLVALGTIADLVPMDYNNRILVFNGLKRIKSDPRVGVQQLIEQSKCDLAYLTSEDIGYQIAPKLNAAGRLKDISVGIQCLLSQDKSQAFSLVSQLCQLNSERKNLDQHMIKEAEQLLQNNTHHEPAIVLYQPDWHQGVIGILASKLKEKMYQPVFIFARTNDNELKGSGRSISGINLKEVLSMIHEKDASIMNGFGGHAMAAGLSIPIENIERFKQALFREISSYSSDLFKKTYASDGALFDADLSIQNALAIEANGPWGQTFEEPLFHGHFKIVDQTLIGGKHLKLNLRHFRGTRKIPAIIFNIDPDVWSEYETIEAIYRLKINRFRKQHLFQLQIIDAKKVTENLCIQ